MSFPALRKSGLPRQTFSHEQLLQLCGFYQNLLAHLRSVQGEINAAIEEFQHTQSGRPTPYTTRLIERLSTIDAGIRLSLHDEIMQVELAAIRWQDKSARLRAEAKRQRTIRARKRINETGEDNFTADEAFTYTEPGTDPFANDEPTQAPPVSPTMALAQRGMSQLPLDIPAPAPENAAYKKSGLV